MQSGTTLNLLRVKPVLTASEYRRVDKAYEGDLSVAMERAGLAVALAASRRGAGYGARVVVLAGPGNNGGDGYVAARRLAARGVAVSVQRLGEPRTDEAIHAARGAASAGVRITKMGDPFACDLVIDAVFGGGVRGDVPEVVSKWSAADIPVVAVDFPTGLDPDTGIAKEDAFRAVETVTFGSLKTGHILSDGPGLCGLVTVADIGIEGGSPSLWIAEEADAPRPARPRTAHKWSAGSVLVAGGSDGMVGAAVLAARAALSFGAGSVYVTSPNPGRAHLAAPQVPSIPIEDAMSRLARFDVLVAGPGLAEGDLGPVADLVTASPRTVLDAGALRPELVEAAKAGNGGVVVTPHAGEFKNLAGVGPGKFSTRSYARRNDVVLLAKGSPTVVTDGGTPVLVTTGTQALASIGTGDVLAGMIGALWARGLDPMAAAISAAYWHGVAGAEISTSRTLTANMLADEVGRWAW